MAMVTLQNYHAGKEIGFKRFFISFSALKHGFSNGCRRFIGLNRCHLKEPHRGVLLSTVTLDATNGVFPIVICIYEGENL